MEVLAHHGDRRTENAPAVAERSAKSSSVGGDWPRTTRVLPWSVAFFLVILWLVPFDAVALPVALPFESKLDRIYLILLAGVWLLVLLASRGVGPGWRRTPINVLVGAFLAVAAASILFNAGDLHRLGELSLAIKKLILLLSFATFFVIAATTIRRSEVRAFLTLTLVLATITAIGTAIEYRTEVNHFYSLAADLIPGASVAAPPISADYGRPEVVGPTQHGLAVTAMLAMVLPVAFVRMAAAPDRRRRLMYAVVVAILLAGTVSTIRKTAFVAPAVAMLLLVAYRPKAMIRLVPLGLVVVLLVSSIAPGAVGGVRWAWSGGTQNSTDARTADYSAIVPDLVERPVLGRGYGSYDPKAVAFEGTHRNHRTLDNQYLGVLLDVGVVGAALYVGMWLGTAAIMHGTSRRKTARSGDRDLALVVVIAVSIFGVVNLLFDVLSFPHLPYLFFFFLALAAVVGGQRESATRRPQSPAT